MISNTTGRSPKRRKITAIESLHCGPIDLTQVLFDNTFASARERIHTHCIARRLIHLSIFAFRPGLEAHATTSVSSIMKLKMNFHEIDVAVWHMVEQE